MIAFHGKQSIKTKYLNRVIRHKKADQLVQGYGYFKDGKGGAVGCTVHSSSHVAYETELGIPITLAKLEDRIFEGLPVTEARRWPSRFLRAIKPGADLSGVWIKYAVWLLTDPVSGVIRHAKTQITKDAIVSVSDLYIELAEGRSVTRNQLLNVRSAAYAASYADASASAAYAAYAAAYAADAAADAAYVASYAADAAANAAYAAADADAAPDASRRSSYMIQSEKLLQLLSEAE